MLTDKQIRETLLEKLKKDNSKKSFRIVEELVICNGLARADVALINGKLHGYEIKSDLDTLERLPNQKKYYDLTFEKSTIIIGKKFENKIFDFIPEHWGVILAYENKFGNITFKMIRSAKSNKSTLSDGLLDLLWNDEIKVLLKSNNIKGYSNKPKTYLKELVHMNINYRELVDYAKETLKNRTGWRADLP